MCSFNVTCLGTMISFLFHPFLKLPVGSIAKCLCCKMGGYSWANHYGFPTTKADLVMAACEDQFTNSRDHP